ncbi:MAG TPA: hypothetical protein VMV20_01705, partial [Chitinophagaceae bacterium]|nr:hypothetical protein [Chitinophagaceae bacterium]
MASKCAKGWGWAVRGINQRVMNVDKRKILIRRLGRTDLGVFKDLIRVFQVTFGSLEEEKPDPA